MAAIIRTGVVVCTLAVLAARAGGAEFYRLGSDLANNVSPDGSLVLTNGNVWTPDGGLVPFSTATQIYSRGISNNGYVVGLVDGSYVPARVRIGEAVLELGGLAPGGSGDAFAITPDGGVVVGYSQSATGPQAFRWTSETGMVGLGHLVPVSSGNDAAHAVSADGAVVVGEAQVADGVVNAFRWTQGTGMVSLGDLPGGEAYSAAKGISSDGRVIVGISNGAGGDEAFWWTQESGMVGLGELPGGDTYSMAWAATADGATIVGEARPTANAYGAFIWTAADGMRSLQEMLTEEHGLGAELAGWNLAVANDISDDGRVIVGYGSNPDGELEGFVVVVPEPATSLVGGVAAVMAGFLKRRRG